MKKFALLGLFVAPLMFSACSTIVNGGKQTISLLSNPAEARVEIFNTHGAKIGSYVTPTTVNLERGESWFKPKNYRVKVHKEGYKSIEFTINARVSGWYIAGNLLFGGVIGWLIVDPLTGGMWVLQASGENINYANDEAITITLLENVSPSDLPKLKKIN